MESDRTSAAPPSVLICAACGGEVAPSLLSCPSCHRLVHAQRLKELAESAESSERTGDLPAAMGAWQEAIALLPPESRQHTVIGSRIGALSRRIETSPVVKGAKPPAPADPETLPVNPHDTSRWSTGGAITGAAGTLALVLWKFKFAAVFLLTKAKFLLLGLTKAGTFFSMAATFGLYWKLFGGWFALGLVLSVYVHEMGHVAALVRYGVPAGAPMFLPGFGAMVRSRMAFHEPRLGARVALAGPIWGCGAAVACAAVFLASGEPIWGALARVGAWFNLINLMPIWILDGSKAFRTLNRPQRWLAVTAAATSWAVTSDVFILLIVITGAFRAALDKPAEEPDSGAVLQYIALVALLTTLWLLPVTVPGF
jgi:Zn-dependent protease